MIPTRKNLNHSGKHPRAKYNMIETGLFSLLERGVFSFTALDLSNEIGDIASCSAHYLKFTNGVRYVKAPTASKCHWEFTGEPIYVMRE